MDIQMIGARVIATAGSDWKLEKAKELGGTAIKDAFDVMEIGSMAVLADPAGAVFAVWEPKIHHGSDHVGGKPFTMVWNELATRDTESAAKFYTNLFPWTENKQQMGATEYTVFKTGDAQSGGMLSFSDSARRSTAALGGGRAVIHRTLAEGAKSVL